MSRSSVGGGSSRSGRDASSSSSSSSSFAPRLVETKALRTRHIDTLEVLEDYGRDVDRLQRENKALQQQIVKLVRKEREGEAGREEGSS